MESEPTVSLSPATVPISISPSQENSSDSSHLESLASAGEEDFETASDSDSASESEDLDTVKRTPLPGNTAIPIAMVAGEDVVDENPNLVDEEGVINENPNPVENFEDGVSGVGEKVAVEDLVSADSVHGGVSGEVEVKETSPENSTVDGAIKTEAEVKENGISDAQDEKGEILGGDECEEAPNSVIEGEGDWKPVEEEMDGVRVVTGMEENEGYCAQDENLGGGVYEVATIPVVEGPVDLKPMEVQSEAVRVEENGVSLAQVEIDESLVGGGGSEAVATSPVLEGGADSKLEKADLGGVEVEKDAAADTAGSNQDHEGVTELRPVEVESVAVKVEKDGDTASVGSDQNLGGAADMKPVEEESRSLKAEEVVSAVESKAVEGESNVVEVEEIGGSDSLDGNQNLDGATESKAIESEKIGDANGAGSERSLQMVNVPISETFPLDSVELEDVVHGAENDEVLDIERNSAEKLDVVGAENDEGLDGGSVFVKVDIERNSAEKLDAVNDSEVVHVNPDQASTVLEAKPSDVGEAISVQDVDPSPILAEDSKSRETERELLEISGVTENGNARGVSGESLSPVSALDQKLEPDADGSQVDDDDENLCPDEAEEEDDGIFSNQPPRVAILDSSETAKQIIKEMEEGFSSTSSVSGFESSRDYPRQVDGQIVSDSDEEVDTDEEGDGKELFDSAALAELLKAATGASSDGSITITSQDGTRVFSVDRPAGLGSSAPSLRPAPTRSTRPTLFSPSELAVTGEPENEMDDEEKKLHEKVEEIRVKFLRLVMRLGHSPEDTVAAQVLYRLSLAEGIKRGRQMSRAFSIESAKKKALQREVEGEEDLDFSCNILVLGKTGVGKSATINSIFGEVKSHTNAFQPATSSVREISGVVDGVKIRVIDTPGLRASVMDQAANRKILSSIKKYTKRCPPDIVLYVDRLDTQTRDFNDLPLLRSITSALGSSIWFNAIVALTHAASAPPEGPNGSPLSYEVFIAQRSHVVQHSIRQAAGDMRLMNPVALVENHPSCRRNREGQRVLPNGLSWRPQMLLLCYSSKILSEANSLLKLQDPSPGKLFGFRLRSPPLPFLLSSLLQSRPHPKLSADQGGDNDDSDIDLDDFSDVEQEDEEDEYDQLPPFKPLRKSQIAKLTKEQKRAYSDEYDYRVKLLQKKQWKEELRRLKEMKKRGKSGRDDSANGDMADDYDQDGAPAAVPVPLPDMILPPSFDCDVPTYRYRFLEPTSQLLTRPVLDTHGWDHDCGYDGVSLEESLAIAGRFPAAVAVQITKDKKEFNIHLDSSISAKHGDNSSTLAGFDIQSVGKQLAYILRSETKFKNLKKNKTAAGISVTFLGETVATGLKVEDQLSIGKRVSLVASTGAIRAQGDVAYGANLEARLREKDYPIGQALSTLGLSLMKWRGDLALGANLQSQINIGRNSKVSVRVGLNNKLSGQITVRTSTSEQLQLALVGILPVAISIFRSIWPGESF